MTNRRQFLSLLGVASGRCCICHVRLRRVPVDGTCQNERCLEAAEGLVVDAKLALLDKWHRSHPSRMSDEEAFQTVGSFMSDDDRVTYGDFACSLPVGPVPAIWAEPYRQYRRFFKYEIPRD
jgi:hypothetical protein